MLNLLKEMEINGTLRTLEMESHSQFTDQYVLAVSSQLNAISERGSSLTDFKNMAIKVNIIRYETAVCATCETKPLVKSVRCHFTMWHWLWSRLLWWTPLIFGGRLTL